MKSDLKNSESVVSVSKASDSYVGVQDYLGPPNEDRHGVFHLVRGTDGALYRLGQASGVMDKLVNSGEWEFFENEENLVGGKQEGLENLKGRMISLSENYPPTYVSRQLVDIGLKRYREEEHAKKTLSEIAFEDRGDPLFTPDNTIKEDSDSGVLPASTIASDLRSFVSEKTDNMFESTDNLRKTEKI